MSARRHRILFDGSCQLCETRGVVKSHIHPKFVAQWLKQKTGNRYFRSAGKVNVRVEDFPTYNLLCGQCDSARFGSQEANFFELFFAPYHRDEFKGDAAYDEWMLYFIVSLSWRAGMVMQKEDPVGMLWTSVFKDALQDWRMYLLGELPSPGLHEHYLLPLKNAAFKPSNPSSVISSAMRRYTMMAVQSEYFIANDSLFIFTLLPGMACLSSVYPKTSNYPNRLERRGRLALTVKMKDDAFGTFLNTLATHCLENAQLSDVQAKKVHAEFRRWQELQGSSGP